MRHVPRILLIATVVVGVIAVLGCTRTVDFSKAPPPEGKALADKSGPPPHAPAHGYRHKHPDGVVLVYEAGIGVYFVSGYTDIYYHKQWFYRLHRHSWHSSRHVDGPWQRTIVKHVPSGLLQEVANRNDDNRPSVKK